MTRIAVFLDYQNAYHGAREVFGDPSTDPPTMGHVNPLRLGLLLTQLGAEGDPNRELTAVTVYRGRPGAKSHPNLQSAFDRHVTAWQQMPLVTVRSRPLRYQPTAWSHGAPSEWPTAAGLVTPTPVVTGRWWCCCTTLVPLETATLAAEHLTELDLHQVTLVCNDWPRAARHPCNRPSSHRESVLSIVWTRGQERAPALPCR
ncbi:MAG: hypothetical protein OXG55_00890 [bacterium]|nr:hypothetical protein [bacterium]